MGFAQLIEGVGGLVIVIATLQDVFLTVVVPRRAPRFGRAAPGSLEPLVPVC